jgi:hypothetical protein
MKLFPKTLVLATTLTLVLSLSASATIPTWEAAKTVALPSSAASLYQGNLSSFSCPSAGNCAAGGIYQDATGNAYGLLANEVNGTWRTPVTLSPPANAVVAGGVSLYDVSCGAPGYCSAVGTYSDAGQNLRSFVDDDVAGVWSKAVEAVLPPNALASSQTAQLHSLSCPSAGNCVAIGTYSATIDKRSAQEGFVVNEVNGHWSNGVQVVLPSGTNANPFVSLSQISCASAGNCNVTGSYIDANSVTHALVVNEVNHVWRAGVSLVLPGNASSFAGASGSEISCASAGACTAIGTYNTSSGVQGFVATEVNTTWARATQIQLPSNAGVNPHVFLYGFKGIACPSAGNCTTGGQYLDKSGNQQGFLVNEISGTWQVATELALPAGSLLVGPNGGVVSVTCTANGTCSAGAAYEDSSGNYQAYITSEQNHSWGAGTKLQLPAGSTTVGVDGGVYSVICQKSGSCDAIGSYETASGNYQGFSDHAA